MLYTIILFFLIWNLFVKSENKLKQIAIFPFFYRITEKT
jgi:hypothetical protein